ncbi:MAG: amino acid ABC transporter substrate-binding protein [Caldilineaceae bacterium]|nr:amino acid ABC transporter substrate-binding protein [Caldilineaceae bacterium]MCY4117555.1 amino acid ABC transporter substrate-binding protein [Caldilineaceae bacterium]MDE0068722.1 amino acid ABC transporter substrate-binding protein [Caldilineaceae bacterium]MDE0430492.1 amino acid ABC transporter substrate-binding protein [Caldilineaceae bacterium]
MKSMKRINRTGMILAMVVGMIIAACMGPSAGPEVVESDEPAAAPMQEVQSTLSIVQERGKLVCIGNSQLPGFGFLDSEGNFSGFDVDYCRAIAAAIFGDANALEVRPATARERFTILSSGEGDVIIRNTTWTMSRDTDLGMNFGPTTFYDGQGLMVRKESGVVTLPDLEGASVCVVTGTTTELNLADQFAAAGVNYEAVVFEDFDQSFTAYEEGRCDAVTTDKSSLVSRQTTLSAPADHVILNVTLSKEPLGPAVRHGDDQWFDIVNWVVYATMIAEEAGIDSGNIDSFMGSEDPNIRRLLGLEGDFCAKVGIENSGCFVDVIKQVGNYAEIYNRNLGPDTVFDLPRGLNSLYTDGGILYAPPIR